MLRVLCLNIEGGFGGSSRSLFESIKYLQDADVHVEVWCRREGPIQARYKQLGVKCEVWPDMPLNSSWTEEMTDGRVDGLRLDLAPWLHEAVVKNKKLVLTLDDEYFELTGGLQRWLYLYLRKAAGRQATGWRESFKLLYEKSGSSGPLKVFEQRLRGLIEEQGLPHYFLEEYEGTGGESYLVMTRRGELHQSHPDHEFEYFNKHKRSRPKLL